MTFPEMNPPDFIIQSLIIIAWCSLVLGCTEQEVMTSDSPPGLMAEQVEGMHQEHNMDPAEGHEITASSLYQVESQWLTQNDERIHLEDLKGRFVLLAMTYTNCEFSCPLIVADMKKIIAQVAPEDRGRVHLVLMSIDPDRDTPAAMKAYAARTELDADQWSLLTGDTDDIMEMAALLGVRYKKMPDGEYAHANIITMLNMHGEIVHQQNGLGPKMVSKSLEILTDLLTE